MIEERATLPDGWEWREIGDVTQEVPNVDPRRTPNEFFNYIDISSIDNKRLVVTEAKRLTGREAPSRARRPVQPGDVVFSNVRTYLRNVARMNGISEPAVASTGFTVLRPTDEVTTDFLFRYVASDEFLELITPRQTGTQYPATSDRVVRSQPIPIPPVREQRRIVARLEEIEALRAGIADRLTTARTIVERIRAAVLVAACSGRLTADWREQHRDAVSEEASRRAQPSEPALGMPNTWAPAKIEDVATRITSGPRDWTPYYGRGTSTFVMAQNVRPGKLDWSFRQAVDPPPDDPSRRRCQIEVGDLLVTIVGANTGDVAPVLHSRAEHFVCQSVALVRLASAEFATYLGHWFTSAAHGRRYFEECMYGAGRPHLSFEQLRKAPIATPPIAEQREINRRIAAAYGALGGLEASIASVEDSLADAWRAGLAKAFRGDLVVSQPRRRHENHLADRAVSTSDGAPTL